MADVFISYKRTDRKRVERIASLLEDQKLDVWLDAQLDVGRGEGFDAEINREVTSAACVVTCWTRDATRSIYVRAESKKGLERNVLIPIFLEPCTLPVPFNEVETVDLSDWLGATTDPRWLRLLERISTTVAASKADHRQQRATANAAYERIEHGVFPGTLSLLVGRIAAEGKQDARWYHKDIQVLLDWLEATFRKELQYVELGVDLAGRQPGGGAWQYWQYGQAAERSKELGILKESLTRMSQVLTYAQSLLDEMPEEVREPYRPDA